MSIIILFFLSFQNQLNKVLFFMTKREMEIYKKVNEILLFLIKIKLTVPLFLILEKINKNEF